MERFDVHRFDGLITRGKDWRPGCGLLEAHGPLAVTILEAARLTSLSRSTIYELLKEGKLKSIKVAGRHLVDYPSIKALMATGSPE
jgi:excisionase family DNA binding protein